MTGTTNNTQINGDRLWQTIMCSGEIGRGRSTGLSRLTLSDADKEVRDLFVSWCEEAGCTVTIDRVGSIFARRVGTDEGLAPVLIGSHLDTQAAGGKYDGILGVMAGLEIIRTLNDLNISTRRSIEVVNWTNEEGARFIPPITASGAFIGDFDVNWVLDLQDDDGKRFGDELERIGYNGSASVGGRDIDAYYELHIEQGPELDAEGINVGIVTGGYHTVGLKLEVHGETAHSGPTPMDKRRNALVGAAMLIVATNEIGWTRYPLGKSTAPRISCWPNRTGILPEYAQITVDFRHPDGAETEAMVREFEAKIPECAQRAQVDIDVVQRWSFGSEEFDEVCIEGVRLAAKDLGIEYREMLSQAGHDAYNLTRYCPSALIFAPCREGISHNEAEHIDLETTLPSVNVLLHAVLKRANR